MSKSAAAVMSWLAGATAALAMMMLDHLLVKQAAAGQQRQSAAAKMPRAGCIHRETTFKYHRS
jgi:hypothetical protein